MITPRFRLEQDDNFVTVYIHAPFARISDAEIFMENEDFRFHSNPYYLRLSLPGPIHETDDAKARYDTDTSSFVITCPKVNKGQHFQGLDLLTKLLQPKGKQNVENPVLDITTASEDSEDASDSETEFDWFISQKFPENEESGMNQLGYGFAQKQRGVFKSLTDELQAVVDVRFPDDKTNSQLRDERLQREEADFDKDYYLADFFQENSLKHYFEYEPSFHSEECSAHQWTDAELDFLKDLPNKDFLIEPDNLQSCYLGLINILFAYCYDTRTTLGEHTVESAWTISKLSGTLSWLETFSNINDVVSCCVRRSLCYPLFRNYKLSLKILRDTETLLRRGRKTILRCLVDTHNLFNASEPRYLLNQLYIQDYCIWIQQANEDVLESLAGALNSIQMDKEQLNFGLVDIEQEALSELFESSSSESSSDESGLEEQLSRMKLGNEGAIPMDLQIAAKAARDDESLDSDDLSSEEETE